VALLREEAKVKLLGYSGREFLRIGFAASVFFVLAKYLGAKSGVPALESVTNRL